MQVLPKSLENLIEAFGVLPGVGPRSAERFAYYLFKQDPILAKRLANEASKIHEELSYCPITFALISKDQIVSPLYDNISRNKSIIAVVADPFDIVAIEKTGLYNGTYHVLGGLISPIDGVTPDELHIVELIKRIDKDKVAEIILATNASVEGETTAIYLQKELKAKKIKITRLARGLPVGVDLEYADQITLSRALEGRTLV